MGNQSRIFAGVLIALVAGGTGGVVAWVLHPGGELAPRSTVATTRDAQVADMLTEMRALTEAVRALVDRPARVADSDRAAPQPLTPSASSELVVAVRQLTELVEAMSRSSPAQAGGPDVRVPVPEEAAAELAKIAASWGRYATAPFVNLFGMTPAMVLARFGRPNWAHVGDGGVTWSYENRDTFEGKLSITFAEGYVVRTFRD